MDQLNFSLVFIMACTPNTVYRVLTSMKFNSLLLLQSKMRIGYVCDIDFKKKKNHCTFTDLFLGVGVGLLFGSVTSKTPSVTFAFTFPGTIFSENGIV